MTELYAALGVAKSASVKQIHAAYREQAKAAHPDAPGGSVEKFAEIALAHDVLSDPKRRARYDRTGEAEPKVADPGQAAVLSMISMAMEQLCEEAQSKGIDPRQVDMVGAMLLAFAKYRRQAEDKIARLRAGEAIYRRFSRRFRRKNKNKPNVLDDLVAGRMMQFVIDIQATQRHLDTIDEAEKLVAEHFFERDAPAAALRPGVLVISLSAMDYLGISPWGGP